MSIPPDYHTPARQAVHIYLHNKPRMLPGTFFLEAYQAHCVKYPRDRLTRKKFLTVCFQELDYQEAEQRKACLASAGGCKFPDECGESVDCHGRLISCKQVKERY